MLVTTQQNRRVRERGQAMVLFAIILPVILAFGSVVISVGNWWVHKRHLQTQVDAAVFAAAPSFVGCFQDPTTANAAIARQAVEYSGDWTRTQALAVPFRNPQVQQPNDVHVVLNTNTYWKTGDPTDDSLDNTLGTPCDTRFLDAKATDDEAPTLWGWLPFVASPKSHAKVEIRDLKSGPGILPWAVPEIDPAAVVALFVNENLPATSAIFDFQRLLEQDDPLLPWSEWQTPATEVDVTINGPNTGVVILVSKNDTNPSVSADLNATCNPAGGAGLIRCYSGATSTSGLSFIHGYQGSGNGAIGAPIVRNVSLFPVGCGPADLSAAYFTLDGDCSARVEATIDFGGFGAPDDPFVLPYCVEVTASPGGTMNYIGGDKWETTIALPAVSGRTTVNLNWTSGPNEQGNSGNCAQNQPNSGSFTKVAAPYVANAASGPIQYLQLTGPLPDANSVEYNPTTKQYTVTVGLPVPLEVKPYTDPPILLRMASPSGSQNQAIDCDKNRTFREEVAEGCITEYRENYGNWDLDPSTPYTWNNILCTGYSTQNLPPVPPGPDPPNDCAMTETGDKTGQLRFGLADRFETPDCSASPNNWPTNAAEAADFFGNFTYANDKRYVTLIITDATAFTGQGSEPIPVKYIAGFYARGWDVGGGPQGTQGCPDNDPHPIYGSNYPPSKDNGDVWGSFIEVVFFTGAGTPGDELCTFGQDPAACIAVLVE